MPDRIMVVDDEVQKVEAASMVLEGEGYTVLGASNGDEPLEKADAEIAEILEAFRTALVSVLGASAKTVERFIARTVYWRLGLNFTPHTRNGR